MMISKAQIKQVCQLHQKKYRDQKRLFIAEGPKIVNEILNSNYKVRNIFAVKEYSTSGIQHPVSVVSNKELESISTLTTPNQVLGVFEIPSPLVPRLLSFASELVLALDNIRDPGNLGTIIRIADWFGISHIFCSETCVDVYNPKVIQATMGSVARVEINYINLNSFLSESLILNPKSLIYAAVMNGKNIYTEKLSDKGIILIGNESKGISENLMQFVTNKISIPNFGRAESLNAAIAAAIICSEFKRR